MTPENRPALQDQTLRTAAGREALAAYGPEIATLYGDDVPLRLSLAAIEAEAGELRSAASLSAGDQVVDSFRRQARTILKSEWFRQRRRSLRTSEQPTVAQVIWLVEQLAAQPASRSGYHPAPPEPERPHPNPEGEWG